MENTKFVKSVKSTKSTKSINCLQPFYNPESKLLEIGIDEVGRGPMFGRVYCAAVILPNNSDFKYELLKDSKKFSSKKKINEIAEYIKENAITWHISYEDESIIDSINIRKTTHKIMQNAILNITNNHNNINNINNNILDGKLCNKYYLLIDGNDFKSYTYLNTESNMLEQINHILIEGGDNKYCSIAAASILAKVERDKYITEMCECYKKLVIYYDLDKNKGYGTAKHMEGIKTYGISPWHRKTYGCCKDAKLNNADFYL